MTTNLIFKSLNKIIEILLVLCYLFLLNTFAGYSGPLLPPNKAVPNVINMRFDICKCFLWNRKLPNKQENKKRTEPLKRKYQISHKHFLKYLPFGLRAFRRTLLLGKCSLCTCGNILKKYPCTRILTHECEC